MKKIFTVLAIAGGIATFNAQVVINEVYGGGGNSGSTYKNDFVELYNRGNTEVTLENAFIQYASTSGSFGSTTNPLSNKLALPKITLAPGQFYLIQMAAGSGGTKDLPEPDFAPTGKDAPNAPLLLSGSGGKVALTKDSTSPDSATGTNVIDFLGWGTANMYEGAGAAPGTANSESVSRDKNGTDTDNNKADFTKGSPSPTNSKTIVLGTKEITRTSNALVKSTVISNSISFAQDAGISIYNAAGQLIISQEVKKDAELDVTSFPAGVYHISGIVKGEKVTQKIIKK